MNRGRRDRSGLPGLRVATGSGDLIEDIHRQQRRRLLKRAAKVVALAVTLLLIGVAIKVLNDRRARAEALDTAYEHFVRSIPAEIELSIEVLELSIDDVAAEHPPTLAARALARAHLWAEFGLGQQPAQAAVEAVPAGTPGRGVAQGLLALADGDLNGAAVALEQDEGTNDADDGEPDPFVVAERAWLDGRLAIARSSDDPEALAGAAQRLEARLQQEPQQVSVRRQLALAQFLAGRTEDALEQLATAREHAPSHMGLSADEALYNAVLRQRLSGVASVADQLLDGRLPGMSRQDQAHAQLARAVVHVQSGEDDEGLEMLDQAWEGLPAWDRWSRRLAIQSALEAGDASRIEAWVEQTTLPEEEAEVFRAWAILVEGDVMEALRRLAALPQADRWVAYLQALALVEQGRYAEAGPWIDRTEAMLPGRLEIEVARARVELRQGDKKVALRKLEALAQEEAHAPRAWTGLAEAYLLQDEPDEKNARKALERAIEREAHPAEAMLLLAQIWDRKRKTDPEAIPKARELMERAAETNTHLPRYREALALYLADIGYPKQARAAMEELREAPGIGWPLLLRLARLQGEAEGPGYDPEPLFEQARALGAPPDEIVRIQAALDVASDDKARVSQAQQVLAALLERAPQDIEARVLYARTFLQQFDRKAAESAIRRGLAVVDESKEGRLVYEWAQIESRTGKNRLAAPRARRAWLRMLDEDVPPYELLDVADLATRSWLKIDRERSALGIAEQLTGRLGYHSMAWTIRARTELQANEAAAARDSALKAIALDADNPRAHEIHGHALLRFGAKEQARAAYQRALDLGKGTAREDEYRANLRRL